MNIRITEDQPFVKLDAGRCFWIRIVDNSRGDGNAPAWRIVAWRREQPEIIHPLSRDFPTSDEAVFAMKTGFNVDVASNSEIAAILDQMIAKKSAWKLV